MSWQAASLVGLALVIAIGFAWYERSRPSSRVVALVAALAALAVASRLVLAPIPNVVGTTDVALLTGYALGGAPGFAVGALAAPISNIWLGQGPWTVWQMGGWGLAGLVGAGLALIWGRELGRLGLAIGCAAMGLLYGLLLDLSVMVTYGGEQSLDRYLALAARGVPFNIAHAAGNFAIAFAAGPALVRMIERYRTRFAFRWHPAGALPVALAAALISLGSAPPPAEAGVSEARSWLERVQEPDGGYAATPGQSSSPRMTAWAMLGMEAAGRNPLDVGGRRTPVDYLRTRVGSIDEPNELQLAILALEGAGINSRNFAGRNLVSQLARAQASDGSWQGQVNGTAYGILALRAGGASDGIGAAARWLSNAQNSDGGWGIGARVRSDPDSTGAALQGLAAARAGGSVADGVGYLRRTQKNDGGWGINETGPTNSQSTALALAGLVAAGIDPSTVKRGGRSGVSYVAARQASDGRYNYSASGRQTPVWVTSQVLIGVSREALPIEPVGRSSGGVSPHPDVSAGAGPPASTHPAGSSNDGRGSRARSKENGGKEGKRGGSSAAGKNPGTPAPDAASVLADAAEASPAEPEPAADDAGLSDAAKAGIAGGAILLLAAGGIVAYRRGA